MTRRKADPGPVLAAISDPTRREVIRALSEDGPRTLSDLASDLPVTRQAVAKHLALLEEAGLVEASGETRRRTRAFRSSRASSGVASTKICSLRPPPSDTATGTPSLKSTRLPASAGMVGPGVTMPIRLRGSAPDTATNSVSGWARRTPRSKPIASGKANC